METETAEPKQNFSAAYTEKIITRILERSFDKINYDIAKHEWDFIECIDEKWVCELCDCDKLEYKFLIRNRITLKELWIGSDCVNNYMSEEMYLKVREESTRMKNKRAFVNWINNIKSKHGKNWNTGLEIKFDRKNTSYTTELVCDIYLSKLEKDGFVYAQQFLILLMIAKKIGLSAVRGEAMRKQIIIVRNHERLKDLDIYDLDNLEPFIYKKIFNAEVRRIRNMQQQAAREAQEKQWEEYRNRNSSQL